jgi:hypothetical protein
LVVAVVAVVLVEVVESGKLIQPVQLIQLHFPHFPSQTGRKNRCCSYKKQQKISATHILKIKTIHLVIGKPYIDGT